MCRPSTLPAAMLRSARPELMLGRLFPDQIVVLGHHPLLIPYVDPGMKLARFVSGKLLAHVAEFGHAPKVVYLVHHGIFALGATS